MAKKTSAMTPEEMQEEIAYIGRMLENGGTPEVSLNNIPSYLRVQMVNADKLNATVLSRALEQVAQGLDDGGTIEQAYEDFKEWMGMSDTEGESPTFGAKTAKSIWEDEFDPGARIRVSSPSGDFEATVDGQNPDGTLQVITDSGVRQDVNIVDVVRKIAAWQDWQSAQGVEVVTKQGADIFDSLEEAQQAYPGLDPERNTKDFTWAMAGQDGRMRFESWEMYEMLSSSKKADWQHPYTASDPQPESSQGFAVGDIVEIQEEATDSEGESIPAFMQGLVMEVGDGSASVRFVGQGRIDVPFDGLKKIAVKVASGEYLYEPNAAEAWMSSTSINTDRIPESGRVRVIPPPPNVPKPPSNLVYVENAETGEFIGLVNKGSLTKVSGRADDKGVTEQDVEPEQLEMGREVEKEHHDDCPGHKSEELATDISLDHLAELPDYYDRLKRMEDEGKKDKTAEGEGYSSEELEVGIKVEMQMGGMSYESAERAAKQMLEKDPSYYTKFLNTGLNDLMDKLKRGLAGQKTGEREDLPKKTRWCELCQNPSGEFDDIAWEKRLHLCDQCLHEGFGESKVTDLAASRKKADTLPGEISAIIERFKQSGVTDFETWEGIAPGEWKVIWTDDETNLPMLLTVSPKGWTFVAQDVHVQRQGFDYPPDFEELINVWGEARDAWETLHGGETSPLGQQYMAPDTKMREVEPGSMLAGGESAPGRYGVLAGLGDVIPPIKMAEYPDESVSPLHRFYQERDVPGDPQRTIVADGVSKVHEVFKNLGNLVRLMGIQFERIEATRYAGTDKHIDRGRLWLKAEIMAGAPTVRKAKLSVVLTIKNGEISDAAQFVDASQKHRLLSEVSLKAYLHLQDAPAIMRAPTTERAQIDRTILPPTPSKSLFHGRGGVDA